MCHHCELLWTWYRLNLVVVFKHLLISQLIPENPSPHSHANWFTPSIQVPPFWHGLRAQSSTSKNRSNESNKCSSPSRFSFDCACGICSLYASSALVIFSIPTHQRWCKLCTLYARSLKDTLLYHHCEWIWHWCQICLLGVFKYLLLSQLIPENPGTHWHVNWFIPSVQLPPFWHGLRAQSSISENK